MKKQTVKKLSAKPIAQHKCRLWLWVVAAFFGGFIIGYATHYTIVNWHGFFATCPNGERPDKNGCCAGEVYTDLGGLMVCCPDGGDNCFPPIK